jgi:predicted Zn-dependent protease
MRRFWLAIIILSLIIGCGSSIRDTYYVYVGNGSKITYKIIPVYIDKNFSDGDKRAIDDAIMEWNYVLNGYIEIRVMSTSFDMEIETLREAQAGRALLVMKVDSNNPQIPVSNKGSTILAWVNVIGGRRMYIVRDRLSSEDIRPIALHEFGHALGSDHEKEVEENKNKLMYPQYIRGNFICVDYWAMEKVAYYQGLDKNKLNYCHH